MLNSPNNLIRQHQRKSANYNSQTREKHRSGRLFQSASQSFTQRDQNPDEDDKRTQK